MEFKYHRILGLPSLAWCAVISSESPEVHLYHGNGIETFEKYFVEGAWDGEFCSGDFDKSEIFIGSGGKLLDDGSGRLLFATSDHTLERLYSIVVKNIMFISNSMPFVLYMSGSELDPDYLDYESDFNSILKGINKYTRNIPLKDEKVKSKIVCKMPR
jgi:hypothetical protein